MTPKLLKAIAYQLCSSITAVIHSNLAASNKEVFPQVVNKMRIALNFCLESLKNNTNFQFKF